MYRKILVGYDDSDQAKDALALGKQLADATGAELVVAGVFVVHPMWHGGIDPTIRDEEVIFARKLEAAANSVGAAAEPVPSTSPARGLHEIAEETNADLIVVGSTHHGRIGRVLAGSVGVALFHGARSPSRHAATASTPTRSARSRRDSTGLPSPGSR
jgi:nucleotide-binding universal stress UspA family protein